MKIKPLKVDNIHMVTDDEDKALFTGTYCECLKYYFIHMKKDES
jgi:hypothetical protein